MSHLLVASAALLALVSTAGQVRVMRFHRLASCAFVCEYVFSLVVQPDRYWCWSGIEEWLPE